MKNPTEPYYGYCQGCNRKEWLDVAHACAVCFGNMDMEERSVHMAHIRWVQAGRPEDTDNPWTT